MGRILICLLWLIPALARAEAAAPLPLAAIEELKMSREVLLEEGTRLILGYGAGETITGAGLELAIAHERATRRAAAAERVMAADLNGDGAVSAAEMDLHGNTLSVRLRAQARRGFAAADRDLDGLASLPEIMAAAQDYALERFPERQADRLRSLMFCDADRDGVLTLAELRAAGDDLARRAEESRRAAVRVSERDL